MSIFSDKFDQLKKADKAVKSPKYLQEVMGSGRIAENGIFEVGKGIYSRTYRFLDINYVTAGAEEQMRILKQYCKTVNAIDIYFLITSCVLLLVRVNQQGYSGDKIFFFEKNEKACGSEEVS